MIIIQFLLNRKKNNKQKKNKLIPKKNKNTQTHINTLTTEPGDFQQQQQQKVNRGKRITEHTNIY